MAVESFSQPGITVNNGYVDAIVWEGVTTEGDTCQITHNANGSRFWAGRAQGTQTYQGIAFAGPGQKASNGLKVTQISSGRVYIYFREV